METQAEVNLQEGHDAFSCGDYAKAYDVYYAWASQNSDFYVWTYAANSALHLEKYQQAHQAFENALKIKYDNEIAGRLAATCALARDIEAYKKALASALENADSFETIYKACANALTGYTDRFGLHYYQWRQKRIAAITNRYGAQWFQGKKILELGCGYGDLGMAFVALGAQVTFCEGRKEHLDVMQERYPDYPKEFFIHADLNKAWEFDQKFDMVIHFGLLYHLKDWKQSLKDAYDQSTHMVLETEVCDSDNPECIVMKDECAQDYDQALGGVGSRPSAGMIEKTLKEIGWAHERLTDASCNSDPHCYDWEVKNTKAHGPEYRRLWFCSRDAL